MASGGAASPAASSASAAVTPAKRAGSGSGSGRDGFGSGGSGGSTGGSSARRPGSGSSSSRGAAAAALVEREDSASLLAGRALSLSDDVLVGMLAKKPKHVPELQSREAFRRFFAGMPRERMLRLLRASVAAGSSAGEDGSDLAAEDRVARRMALVEDVLE